MIPRTNRRDSGWLTVVLEGLGNVGCAVVEEVVTADLLEDLRVALRRAQQAVRSEIGVERLERAGELGVVRAPMRFDPTFYRLLEIPEVLRIVDETVSSTAILHLQNLLILPPASPEQLADLFQLNFHMDFRRVLNGFLCSINTLFAIDEFREDNGATLLVPGTHQRSDRPDREYLRSNAIPAVCPAGSVLVFDSTLWHAAGQNLTDRDRLAINQQFTRSYFKQQIDYLRALGDEEILRRSPRTQQILGWYTRVPASLEAYYAPTERRLYRAGQG
jgi:ectoine hydroxylase-related dioxygenase (phytanoyl-CoA dioxygenase family)